MSSISKPNRKYPCVYGMKVKKPRSAYWILSSYDFIKLSAHIMTTQYVLIV